MEVFCVRRSRSTVVCNCPHIKKLRDFIISYKKNNIGIKTGFNTNTCGIRCEAHFTLFRNSLLNFYLQVCWITNNDVIVNILKLVTPSDHKLYTHDHDHSTRVPIYLNNCFNRYHMTSLTHIYKFIVSCVGYFNENYHFLIMNQHTRRRT